MANARFSVDIPEEYLILLDNLAEEGCTTRDGLICAALSAYFVEEAIKVIDRGPDAPPIAGDELPEGYVSTRAK